MISVAAQLKQSQRRKSHKRTASSQLHIKKHIKLFRVFVVFREISYIVFPGNLIKDLHFFIQNSRLITLCNP